MWIKRLTLERRISTAVPILGKYINLLQNRRTFIRFHFLSFSDLLTFYITWKINSFFRQNLTNSTIFVKEFLCFLCAQDPRQSWRFIPLKSALRHQHQIIPLKYFKHNTLNTQKRCLKMSSLPSDVSAFFVDVQRLSSSYINAREVTLNLSYKL